MAELIIHTKKSLNGLPINGPNKAAAILAPNPYMGHNGPYRKPLLSNLPDKTVYRTDSHSHPQKPNITNLITNAANIMLLPHQNVIKIYRCILYMINRLKK
jgi:hypothetical protein